MITIKDAPEQILEYHSEGGPISGEVFLALVLLVITIVFSFFA